MSEIETLLETDKYLKNKISSLTNYLADVCCALRKLSDAKTCAKFCMLSNSNRKELLKYYEKEFQDTNVQLRYYKSISRMVEKRLNYLKQFQY